MLSYLKAKYTKSLCALELSTDGLALASGLGITDQINLKVCEFYPYQDQVQPKSLLSQAVITHNLQNADCIWVLHPDYYRILLLNAPNVPPSEYAAAIPWQIKDMTSYPIDDLAMDYFVFENPAINLKKLYVVVAQQSFLTKNLNMLAECQLNPIAIDIREFAIRNLVKASIQAQAYWGLHIEQNRCLLMMVQQGKIVFTRSLAYGWQSLTNDEAIAQLSNEIRRSISYCDTELKILLPDLLVFLPGTTKQQTIFTTIADNLAKNYQLLTYDLQCWPAIGGLLRTYGTKY